MLNTRAYFLKLVKLYSGFLNSASARVRQIFNEAILENANVLILAHNCPSGDPIPSPEGVALTCAISPARKLLASDVLDYLVIGNFSISVKQRGLGLG